jgi:hypothetical protein
MPSPTLQKMQRKTKNAETMFARKQPTGPQPFNQSRELVSIERLHEVIVDFITWHLSDIQMGYSREFTTHESLTN